MYRIYHCIVAILAWLLAPLPDAGAAGLPPIGYGGRIVDASGAPMSGSVDLSFAFYASSSGGSALGPGAVTFTGVVLKDGTFFVELDPVASGFVAVFADPSQPVWIEVTDVTHARTLPRQRFLAVPYALRVPVDGTTITYDANGNLSIAAHSHTLAGDVTGDVGTTTVAKLQGRAVSSGVPTSGHVLKWNGTQWASAPDDGGVAGAVSNGANLGTGDATTADVFESTVAPNMRFRRIKKGTGLDLTQNADDITLGVATGGIASGQLAADAVTSAKILDGTIATADVADSQITSAKIADGTIVTADVGDAQITSAKLATGAIGNGALAGDAVTSAKVLDGTIATADVGDAQITNAKLASGIDAAKLTTGSIDYARLPVGTAASTIAAGDDARLTAVATKVTGPASATDEALVRYDGTTGKLVQSSNATLTDAGDLTVAGTTSTSALKVTTGAGAGRVLKSDASGNLSYLKMQKYLAGARALSVTSVVADVGEQRRIQAQAAALSDASGDVLVFEGVDVTIDLGNSGLGGLDTGTKTASTWYYLWLISNGTVINGIFSASATAPTMPAGYTYKLLVSANATYSGGPILFQIMQYGQAVRYSDALAVLTGGGSTSIAAINMASVVPPGAVEATIYYDCYPEGGTSYYHFCYYTTTNAAIPLQHSRYGFSSATGDYIMHTVQLSVPLFVPQTGYYWVGQANGRMSAWVTGYTLNFW